MAPNIRLADLQVCPGAPAAVFFAWRAGERKRQTGVRAAVAKAVYNSVRSSENGKVILGEVYIL